jgi:hypothetical protein
LPDHRLHPLIASLAAALPLVLLSPAPALADKAPRVGIVVSVQVNLKKSESQELSAALGRALHARLVVDVIAGAEANRRLPAEGVSESCVADDACIKDTAQRLTADEILFLAAVRVGSRIQVDSTWVDPASSRSASRPKVVMVKLDEAESRFAEAASLILPDAEVRQAEMVSGRDDGGGGGTVLVRTTPRRMTAGVWVAGGIAVAALGAGIGFTLAAASADEDCTDRENDANLLDECSDSELDAIDRNAITADIFWGAAIASGVAAIFLYYTSGGEIERIPVAARALRLRVGGDGSAFLSLEGPL